MANVLVNDLYLGDIADAIRSKLNVQTTYKPSQMANAIESIGGGGSSLGTKSITANGTYNASSDSLDGYSQVTVNVPTGAAKSSTDLTANNLTVTAPAGLYSSDASKTLTDANLTAGNIKKDVTIFGVTGSYEGGSGGNTYRKVTGSVAGNGTNCISFSVSDGSPDLIWIYRSDIDNPQAVSDRAHCATLDYVGKAIGSMYTAANSTSILNSAIQVDAGIYAFSPSSTNRVGYENGTMYIRSGNNSNLWSTSLTYNYELYYFS